MALLVSVFACKSEVKNDKEQSVQENLSSQEKIEERVEKVEISDNDNQETEDISTNEKSEVKEKSSVTNTKTQDYKSKVETATTAVNDEIVQEKSTVKNYEKDITKQQQNVKSKVFEKEIEMPEKTTPKKPEQPQKEEVEKVEQVLKDQKPKTKKSGVSNKPLHANADHRPFHKLLQQYVNANGDVNYKGIKSDIATLNAYVESLSQSKPSTMSQSEQLAFWINAYNAFTLKLIADNYPVKSITNLEGGKPWDKKWIKLNGQTLSLNQIEHEIIRPAFKEPRIHFAVNCAASSCPPILNQAFSPGNLNTNLHNSTKDFINNPAYNKIAKDKIQVSKIFEWYADDFGNLIEFLNKYSAVKIDPNASVEFLEYDWALNEQ